MRRVDRLLEDAERVLVHAQRVDAAGERAFIENTNDDLFAVDRGQERDTKIDFLAGDADAEAAVLRQAALGDVEAGENLDARGDRQLQRLGRRRGLHEVAVDAVAELDPLLEGLDVNVRRLFLERLHEDEIDDLDDRRVLAFHRQAIEVDVVALRCFTSSTSASCAAASCITLSICDEALPTPLSASVTARSVVIIGTISSFVRCRRSSSASTLSGSAIATKSLFPSLPMGASL